MLLALLVLLASSFTAMAEEDPDSVGFRNLRRYVFEAMDASLQQQAGEVNYTVMAHRVRDALRAPERYTGDRQKFATVCWRFTGPNPLGPGYIPGHSYGTALGGCNDERPPPSRCWETGGAVGIIPTNHGRPMSRSICVVFFSPRGEPIIGGAAATAFTQQALDNAHSCAQEYADERDTGVIDLSHVANCVAATRMTTERQDRGPPRAVIAVPLDAAPGRSAPDGHILSLDFHVIVNGVPGPYLWLVALPPAHLP